MSDFRSPAGMPLDRYRTIVGDWRAFRDGHRTPEPVGLRVRTGRVSPFELRSRLEAQGFRLTSVPGASDLFQLQSGPKPVSLTMEHWLGLFHVQQTVMALPSLALAPEPGDRVLDLCAAPGGKTTHLAELMGDRGPLVAVDRREKRLRGLLANVFRLGHPNVLVVAADGRSLPPVVAFDRVLVDAPCSAEGNSRRQGKIPRRDEAFTAHVTGLQEALLRRAIQLTRPGGLIVYATCTYAPEENEAVVSRMLSEEQVRLEDIPLPFPHAEGLESWAGASFHPDLPKAWRLYPHHLDSGGGFLARLRRLEGSGASLRPSKAGPTTSGPEEHAGATGWTPVPEAFPGEALEPARERIARALERLRADLGFPGTLVDELSWIVRGESIWAHTTGVWPVQEWEQTPDFNRWRVVSQGIRALKRGPGGKETPSNRFLMRWGRSLPTDRRVDLDLDQLARLLDGEPLPLPPPHIRSLPLEPASGPGPEAPRSPPFGPVAITWDGMVLGRGIAGPTGLRPEIPKALAARLREVVAARAAG